ncbi:Txe/YoeB family addiction module toxin [Limibacterium fermenti]|uniref:Txe/YoeB family addiction module toxin n=1 Tax=Limibacterium fermenti TaxID=3229863 RepID=UPI003A622EDE
MIYRIYFSKEASKVVAKYKKSNPVLYKKLEKLLDEIMEHPRSGIGHPEPLVSGNSATYSRRIGGKDRLIYDIHDETVTVLVLSVEGHYKANERLIKD